MRKVKNWRGSTAAKIIAWIALSASALCFVFSAVGVIFMFDEGIYRNSKDETRKQGICLYVQVRTVPVCPNILRQDHNHLISGFR